jgi:hypothetical protein
VHAVIEREDSVTVKRNEYMHNVCRKGKVHPCTGTEALYRP